MSKNGRSYYLDVLSTLPDEVRENFELLGSLDQQSERLTKVIDADAMLLVKATKSTASLSAQRGRGRKSGPKGRKRAKPAGRDNSSAEAILSKKMRRNRDGSIRIADLKVRLAMQTYDLLDNHIRRIDENLKRFAAELQLDKDEISAVSGRTRSQEGLRKDDSEMSSRGSAAADAAIDMKIDPNEPVYCFCRQVAFGEMVACDNDDCTLEWFHFQCVGLTPANRPKDNWLCPQCTALRRRNLL